MADEKRELTNQEKSRIHRLHPEYSYYSGPKRIYGPLYYVGDNTVSAHLIDTGEGLVLIDSLYPPSVHVLLQQIWEAGFDPANIRYIVHTHAHLDHFGGTKPLVDMFGCRTFMGAIDAELMENASPITMLEVDCYPPLSETRLFKVDERLQDGDAVTLGNIRIEAVSCPGHSPGNMSYFFTVDGEQGPKKVGINSAGGNTPVAYDVLDRLGLPYSLREDFVASAKKLMDREVDIAIGTHPFIGDTIGRLKRLHEGGGENPFIDPSLWRTMMEAAIRSFEDMAEREAKGEKMWCW
jgi:metallo-beta-lactamase class B